MYNNFKHWDIESVRLRAMIGIKPPIAVAWWLAHNSHK